MYHDTTFCFLLEMINSWYFIHIKLFPNYPIIYVSRVMQSNKFIQLEVHYYISNENALHWASLSVAELHVTFYI